ncbi:MAG: 7,8-didemethyl-8-hydroxy-5-deazariboflavin synthase CofG, partial [bacterium]
MATRGVHHASRQLSDVDALSLIDQPPELLLTQAAKMRDQGHDRLLSYSRKVFVPLTQLCRDSCHYCAFAQSPRQLEGAYLTPDQVLDIAHAGKVAGCKEALFTLGDKPELRYQGAREALAALGYKSTIEYLRAMALLVFEETGLLPHLNPGVMTSTEITSLREVSVSMGLMMESTSERLMQKGGCHYGSPDKEPARRLESIDEAGRQSIAFTTGILIGIGETRTERIESLLALRASHARFGHLQEIIIQNFRAKAGTRMALAAEPDIADLQWTVAVARLIFGPHMNIQAPPNLSVTGIADLIAAGINDFGGVSPVTPDYVNPEAPWPHLDNLAKQTAASGKIMVERLALYPEYIRDREHWLDPAFQAAVLDKIDGESLARTDDWSPGDVSKALPELPVTSGFSKNADLDAILDKAIAGDDLDVSEVIRLLTARDGEVHQVVEAADILRQEKSGETVSYVVTRNINYTNICYFKCKFCAFSKGKKSEEL